ncbi:hypothetical protein ES705_31432 [subsurface metagenome]
MPIHIFYLDIKLKPMITYCYCGEFISEINDLQSQYFNDYIRYRSKGIEKNVLLKYKTSWGAIAFRMSICSN